RASGPDAMGRTMRRALAAALAVLLCAACSRKKAAEASAPEPAPTEAAGAPVRVAAPSRRNLTELLSAPGRTAAMAQLKVRAPFSGTLVELKVADGDFVHRGDALGTIVSRESEAALSGAREMAREAKSVAEKADADRAVALAEKGLVRALLRCS